MVNGSFLRNAALLCYLTLEYLHLHIPIASSTIELLWFATINSLGLLLCLLYVYHTGTTRVLRNVFIFIFVASLFLCINSLLYGGRSFGLILPLLSQAGFGLALSLYRRPLIPAAYLVTLFVITATHFMRGGDMNDVTVWSRNNISIYAIATFCIYTIAAHNLTLQRGRPVDRILRYDTLFLLFLTVSTCIMGIGRGGMIAAGLLVVGVVLQQYSQSRPLARLAIVVLGLVVTYGIVTTSLYLGILEGTKFVTVGLASQRFLWFETYFSHIGAAQHAIFGSPLTDTDFNIWDPSNPHNSYFRLHMQMGAAIIIFLWAIVRTMIVFFGRRQYLLLFCLAALATRAFTDIQLLTGNYLNFGAIVALYVLGQRLSYSRRVGDGRVNA